MKSRTSQDSDLIRALEFAYQHSEGFSKEQLGDFLGKEHGRWGDVLKHQFGAPNHTNEKDRLFLQNASSGQYALSTEGTKMLFDIIEIRDAKDQAMEARKFAFLALGASIIIPIVTEFISGFWSTTMQLENKQFEQLIERIK